MSLRAPDKVQKLQTTLHAKAKQEPGFRFYMLHDKVYREDILAHAWRLTKAKGGSAGVDSQTFPDIEAGSVERWLGSLANDLRTKTYRPQPVRRVYIPKPDGRQRPLGIPAIRDRVVQTAAAFVLAPVSEADLQPEQYAYRPGRSAHDAVGHVHSPLNRRIPGCDRRGFGRLLWQPPASGVVKSVARRDPVKPTPTGA